MTTTVHDANLRFIGEVCLLLKALLAIHHNSHLGVVITLPAFLLRHQAHRGSKKYALTTT